MHLEAEANALLVEDVEDRIPACGEVREASLDLGPVVGRKRVEHVPGRRAGEAVDLLDSELCGCPSRVHHLARGALAHALRVTISPHVRRQDRLVAAVDRIANGLPHEVRGDGPAVEPVPLEDLPAPLDVIGIGQGLVDLEVVAPTGELEPIETPRGRLLRQRVQGQIGPLAGEQSHRTSHPRTSSSAVT